MTRVGIALGSNLGERENRVAAGFQFLQEISTDHSILKSSVWETEPVDCPPGSPRFLNAVAEIQWEGTAFELLKRCQEFERECGRPELRPVNAPRPLDLDLLYFGEEQIQNPNLIIPHPRIMVRRFVLGPLMEIRPDLRLPGCSQTVKEGWVALMTQETLTKITAVRKMKGGSLRMLTAYDYPTARLLDEVGVPILLVGDSLGMVVLGRADTTTVTLEEMIYHVRAVAAAKPKALVVADFPKGTYSTPEQAIQSARLLIQAGAEAVKLEGDDTAVIEALVREEIPVMGHLGMLPQRVREEGGYRRKGKRPEDRERLLKEAGRLEKAGVFAIVLELVVAEVAAEMTAALEIPTIGIGSGSGCDGQVLVFHDVVGYSPWFRPSFVTPAGDVAGEIQKAAKLFLGE